MIRGWMTFPSVIIPTPSHLHPLLAHKHTLACARVRQDADSLGGARISAQPGIRVYLSLTPIMQTTVETEVFAHRSVPPSPLRWPDVDLFT